MAVLQGAQAEHEDQDICHTATSTGQLPGRLGFHLISGSAAILSDTHFLSPELTTTTRSRKIISEKVLFNDLLGKLFIIDPLP
jgi:hypothetical protein